MDLYNFLLPAFIHFNFLSYWIIFLISLLESLAFIGLLIPGSLIMILAGFMSAKNIFDFKDLIWFATAGAFFGDLISYYAGRKGTGFFSHDAIIFKSKYLIRGENFFKKYGDKSVFFGRFIGPIRPIIPFVAGLFKMESKKFIFYDLTSGLTWSIFYLTIGYFFGQAWRIIEIWLTRISLVFLIAIIVIVAFYFIKWLLVKKGKMIIYLAKSLLRSIKQAIISDEEVKKIIGRYPTLFNLLKKRFAKDSFSGKTLTILLLALLYVFFSFFGIITDIISNNSLVAADLRIANLLYAFRDDRLTKIFLWITSFGQWQIALCSIIIFSLILWIWRKRIYIAAFWISIIGTELSVFIVKNILLRERPGGSIPVIIEKSFSFPSGHAAFAVALFGFAVIFLWQEAKSWKVKINILLSGCVIIGLIGLSRLYLGVHYFSDVAGGYLLGIFWLLIAVGFAAWAKRQKTDYLYLPYINPRARIVTASLITLLLITYSGYSYFHKPAYNYREEAAPQDMVGNPLDIFYARKLNKYSEKLDGGQQAPLSFLLVAKGDYALVHDFYDSGWGLADSVNIRSVYKIAKAAILNKAYLSAPMTPSFWNRQVNDFGFEKPTQALSVRQRHHSRFWKTSFTTPDGSNIYVGTASLDVGIKWLVVHRIDPDIDSEREVIFQDLLHSGVITHYEKIKLVKSALGKNFAGDEFFTDGQLYVIYLK